MIDKNADDLKNYLTDTYGKCVSNKCTCLKEGWLGSDCPNWVPINLNSFEQMVEKAREIKQVMES